jgi:hypothetical protein
MLPATGVSNTIVTQIAIRNQRLCDTPLEIALEGVNVVAPCGGTNASGTSLSIFSQRLLSSQLDHVWLYTGTTALWKFDATSIPTNADSTRPGDKQIALLEAAAVVANIEQFTSIYQGMDLSARSVTDIIYIVQLALGIGAIALAREVCEIGLRHFTDNSELMEMSSVLAPPRISGSKRKLSSGTRANTEWLNAHADEYRDKWVALRAGSLIAVADSIKELLALTGDVRGTDIFITPVH